MRNWLTSFLVPGSKFHFWYWHYSHLFSDYELNQERNVWINILLKCCKCTTSILTRPKNLCNHWQWDFCFLCDHPVVSYFSQSAICVLLNSFQNIFTTCILNIWFLYFTTFSRICPVYTVQFLHELKCIWQQHNSLYAYFFHCVNIANGKNSTWSTAVRTKLLKKYCSRLRSSWIIFVSSTNQQQTMLVCWTLIENH